MSTFRRSYHVLALCGVHRHRLLAQHWLAVVERNEHMRQVEGVGGGDEDCINFRRRAKSFRRVVGPKWEFTVLLYRFLRLPLISPPQAGDGAVLGLRKTGHEAPDRMQAETKDSVADHLTFFSRSSA